MWSRLSKRLLTFLVDDVTMYAYVLFFLTATVTFGVAYTLLTPIGHGIGQNLVPLSDVSFLTGMYFSVVTISSLGYGQLHPIGFSKVLVSIEVLVGLVVVGIMIAKVTSRRLSYHVSRLFISDAQAKLGEIVKNFDLSHAALSGIMPRLATTYQDSPGLPSSSVEDQRAAVSTLRNTVDDLHSHCVALRDYFTLEVEQGNYFQIVPSAPVVRVGETVDRVFWMLGQLITSMPTQARSEVLDRHNRQRIADSLDAQKRVCDTVDQHVSDERILGVFQRIRETCDLVPASYFAIPEEQQPDQLLQGTDVPQES